MPPQPEATPIGHAMVIGAGLSGAACAFSLAQRGWQVTVLDRAAAPAHGASGLPVGLVVPHTSADDTLISRISRVGIRHTLAQASALLRQGQDWSPTGVLEHCVEGRIKLPPAWADAQAASSDPGIAQFWSQAATAEQVAQALLPAGTPALWHGCAAWIKPPMLVNALLRHARISFVGHSAVATLQRVAAAGNVPYRWLARDASGALLAEADIAVLAAGFDSAAVLDRLQTSAPDTGTGIPPTAPPLHLPLNPLRGQVAWGWMHGSDPDVGTNAAADNRPQAAKLPAFPVNGKGSMAAGIPHARGDRQGRMWITGSTFQRGDTDAAARDVDMPEILAKLGILHPSAAQTLRPQFEAGEAEGWAGVRATLPDRLPAVGAWPGWEGLHLCCGMGARGLTLAVLSAELLAAQLHHGPLPLSPKLAGMLAAGRWHKKAKSAHQPVSVH